MKDSWNIIGWLILGLIGFVILIAIFVWLSYFVDGVRDRRRHKKANAGKLKCEFKGCTKIAEVRTESGFYCREDGRSRSRFAAFSFAAPLDYLDRS